MDVLGLPQCRLCLASPSFTRGWHTDLTEAALGATKQILSWEMAAAGLGRVAEWPGGSGDAGARLCPRPRAERCVSRDFASWL